MNSEDKFALRAALSDVVAAYRELVAALEAGRRGSEIDHLGAQTESALDRLSRLRGPWHVHIEAVGAPMDLNYVCPECKRSWEDPFSAFAQATSEGDYELASLIVEQGSLVHRA